MKKAIFVVLALVLFSSFAFGQWEYIKDFAAKPHPHGIVVDGAGKIWIGYYDPSDSLFSPGGVKINVYPLWVYDNTTDTEPTKVMFLTINGVTDTIKTACRGLSLDNNGNVLFSGNQVLYRINYQTFEGMTKFMYPFAGGLTSAACDANGYIYVTKVVPGKAPLIILNTDFQFYGNVIDSCETIQRALLVSQDGKDVYIGTIYSGVNGVRVWHSDDGPDGTYSLVDTLGTVIPADPAQPTKIMWAQCINWDPWGNMWVGTYWDVGVNDFTGWYALDPKKDWAIVDSIGVSKGKYVYGVPPDGGTFYSPRHIAFVQEGNDWYALTNDFDGNIVKLWKGNARLLEHFTNAVDSTGDARPVIIQHATIDDVPIVTGDEVGIFDGSLCVGAARFSGNYPLAITVWMEVQLPGGTILPGARNGHPMSFKIWQRSSDSELSAAPTYTVGNGIFGLPLTVVDPLAAYTFITQTIAIKNGRLNMISFNILPRDPADLSITSMMNDLGTLLVAQDDDGKFYIPPYGVNTIGNVDLSNGYQVYITGSADDTVMNDGDPLVPQDYSQALNNTKLFMIGYPYQNPHPVTEVFATIASSVVVVQDDEGRFWIPSYGVNTIGNMLPGKGYQIYVDQAVNFTYPALLGGLAKATEAVAELPEPNHFQFQRTGVPYGIVVTGSEKELAVGAEVGVFAGALCVGASVFTGQYPLVITAWEGNEEYGLSGFKAGQAISLRVWNISEGKEMEVSERFATTSERSFRGGPISVVSLEAFVPPIAIPTTFGLNQNYPNPFNPETIIEYQLPKDGKVSLRIHNLLGQEIRSLVDEPKKAGYHQVSWDGKDMFGKEVSSGIYLYTIEAGDFQMTKKMVKMQ